MKMFAELWTNFDMAFFIDEERKFVVYESPKTGGTTLRSWINFAGTGQLAVSGTKDYYYERADVYSSLDDWGYNYLGLLSLKATRRYVSSVSLSVALSVATLTRLFEKTTSPTAIPR